jgi:hypothetical protein
LSRSNAPSMTLWPEAARAREGLRAYLSDTLTAGRSFDLGQSSRSDSSLSGQSVAPRILGSSFASSSIWMRPVPISPQWARSSVASVVRDSFSSDKAQLEPLTKAAFQHKGAAFIDVIRLTSHSTTALARPRASTTCTGAFSGAKRRARSRANQIDWLAVSAVWSD